MTISLWLVLTHFIADFVFQSNWMAIQKSKRWDALTLHVSIYSACFLWLGWRFAFVTFATHFVTDAITSRITSRLWFIPYRELARSIDGFWFLANIDNRQRHWFFVMIGFDQLIHYGTLAWTQQLFWR